VALEYAVCKPKHHVFTFVPQDVGPHVVDLRCGCDTVVGGPVTCNVYDPDRVRIIDITECADIGDEVEFTGKQNFLRISSPSIVIRKLLAHYYRPTPYYAGRI